MACFEKIKSRFGKLDVMVSGISAANLLSVEEFTPEAMNKTFSSHITGSFLLVRNSAELMPDGGGSIAVYWGKKKSVLMEFLLVLFLIQLNMLELKILLNVLIAKYLWVESASSTR